MTPHENVILDLLPLVRNGQASAESRQLVDQYLTDNPQVARFAALMPSPDPSLELRALQCTRRRMSHAGWEKAFAIFFTLLPLSFVTDGSNFRFLFADYPGLMVGFAVTAAAFWARYFLYSRRSLPLR